MKKILLMPCALGLSLLTACFDFCGYKNGEANTKYEWSYTNPDGTTVTGQFETNEYGQAVFDVPEGTDCNEVTLNKKEPEPDVGLLLM